MLRYRLKAVVYVLVFSALLGCEQASHHDPHVAQLVDMVTRQPVEDALRNLQAGNKSLLGFYDEQGRPIVPGVPAAAMETYAISQGLQLAPAMMGPVRDDEHQQARAAFMQYAQAYNQRIIAE